MAQKVRLDRIEKRLDSVEHHVNAMHTLLGSLVDKKQSFARRAVVGVAWMTAGVMIAKYFGHSEFIAVSHIGDMIGYALHGLGLLPFVEKVIEAAS